MYLLDTNVISERRKAKGADPGVIQFLDGHSNELFLPVQVLGEILVGIERIRRRGDAGQAELLQTWYEDVKSEFSDRILIFDVACAEIWGKLMGIDEQNPVDKQIAAIALTYDLNVVTRNLRHFQNTGVRILNPFVADHTPHASTN